MKLVLLCLAVWLLSVYLDSGCELISMFSPLSYKGFHEAGVRNGPGGCAGLIRVVHSSNSHLFISVNGEG